MEHDHSSSLRWRRGLLGLCAVAFCLLLFSAFQSNTWAGWIRVTRAFTAVAFHDTMTPIKGGPAAQAGIKAGDILDYRVLSPADRWRITNRLLANRSYTFTVIRGSTQRYITVRAKRLSAVWTLGAWSTWLWLLGALGALIFAGIIAWRRPWLVEARMLCLLLITNVLFACISSTSWITPWNTLDFWAAQLSGFVLAFTMVLLVAYTLLFGRPISTARKIIVALGGVVIGLNLLYTLAANWGYLTGAFDIRGGPLGYSPLLKIWAYHAAFGWLYFPPLPLDVLAILAIATAAAASRGRERSLLVWTTALPFLFYLISTVPALDYLFANAALSLSHPLFYDGVTYVGNAVEFLTAFAIGYALLNRRLLDIGFVLNRAAVFSIVSVIVIATFIIVEWALGGWLSTASHATNLLVAGSLALALGLSMHQIHGRVDNVVDRVFFSKRRRDQDAITAFSREAAYVSDRDVLLDRTEETLIQHADASAVAILLDDRRGRYGEVSENDPAVLALRTNHNVLDLHGVGSAIRGDYAFPMVSRGRVLGVLVLGSKRSGESYAPDELEAILRLAHGVASALDVLAHDAAEDPVLAQLSSMRETLAAICDTLAALPAAIRER